MERALSSIHATSTDQNDNMTHSYYTTHSRESSAASSTFSIRSHGHWPSSGSSITSAPDSPVMTKSPLGDLVEDPEEVEDLTFDPTSLPIDEALCMCDTTFCPHQRPVGRSVTAPAQQMEWSAGDDTLSSRRSSEKRKSSELSRDSLTSKFNRRFPSISRKWRDSQPTTSLSNPQIFTASPTRSSSLRLPKVKHSLNSALSVRSRIDRSSSTSSPMDHDHEHEHRHQPLDITAPPTPIEEDPINRVEMSRTPLLPPMLHAFHSRSDSQIRSPLQSPSFAPPSAASSVIQSPVSAPAGGLVTPPLSTRPSYTSFHLVHDIPPMHLHEETDPWALKLGHANYHITPEPYLPAESTRHTCKRLLDDWESARMEYMRQAARVSDEYGPKSHTFRLTEEKWGEIDAVWRSNYELANAKAGASGESLVYQPLAETATHQKMPSLKTANSDPKLPAKFPVFDECDMVGPMVQYTKVNHAPAKKPGLLRIFTDPASILAKTSFSFKK